MNNFIHLYEAVYDLVMATIVWIVSHCISSHPGTPLVEGTPLLFLSDALKVLKVGDLECI